VKDERTGDESIVIKRERRNIKKKTAYVSYLA
jgi:hypothetical protein